MDYEFKQAVKTLYLDSLSFLEEQVNEIKVRSILKIWGNIYFIFYKHDALFFRHFIRYKEVPDDGVPPVVGNIYVKVVRSWKQKYRVGHYKKGLNERYGKTGSTIDIVFCRLRSK